MYAADAVYIGVKFAVRTDVMFRRVAANTMQSHDDDDGVSKR